MAPRAYTLRRRAETTSDTRRRILESTIELYRELGVKETTLKAVAERADVSRGTILHHFNGADGLLGAVLDSVLEMLQLPDERMLDGIEGLDARVRAFVDAILEFMDRSNQWWLLFQGQMQRPEVQEREGRYWAGLGALQSAALGPELAADPQANALLLGIIHPATVGTFVWSYERVGLPKADARRAIGDLAVDAIGRVAAAKSAQRGE